MTDEKDLDDVRSAYMFAFEKHFGVKRLTGEDYIIHPLNVAYILTEIYADAQTICAALLHDVVEDCDVTKEEIAETVAISSFCLCYVRSYNLTFNF